MINLHLQIHAKYKLVIIRSTAVSILKVIFGSTKTDRFPPPPFKKKVHCERIYTPSLYSQLLFTVEF